jgi:hypothetical protein
MLEYEAFIKKNCKLVWTQANFYILLAGVYSWDFNDPTNPSPPLSIHIFQISGI